jgi:hypothetical protein
VDYILEFSEWLYYKQFPLDDVICHITWAAEILLAMKPALEPELESEGKDTSSIPPTHSAGRCGL